MQQYIYGDIGGTGYTYVSSLPTFFNDPQHRQRLNPLINYDMGSKHGELSATEHQCVWMLTTNLNIQAEPERLYMQVSGMIAQRTALYTHGYMSDPDEQGLLYGPQMMRLLKTAFCDPKTMNHLVDALGKEETLQATAVDELPTLDLNPARLDEEALRTILMAILQDKAVILRLASTGAEAMREAREVLLTVYQRMPRERRRTYGFVTGASRAMLTSETNPLPGAVRIIVMDQDADVTGFTSSTYRPFVDLAGERPSVPIPRYNGNKELPYVPLLDFLVQAPPEKLEQFFAFCQETLKKEPNGRNPNIGQYMMLFSMFNIEQLDFDEEQLYNWAVSLYDNTWTPQMRELLYAQITRKLSIQTMEQYLLGFAGQYDALFKLGVLEKDDANHSKTAQRDKNAALTLRLIGFLKVWYPGNLEQQLSQTLSRRFVELACAEYPELTEKNPTSATLQSLQKIRLPEEKTPVSAAIVTLTRDDVCRQLKQLREDVKARYLYHRDQQYQQGLQQIEAWFASWQGTNLESLYQELHGHYLWQDLLDDSASNSWNSAIGQQIAAFCEANRRPESVEQCSRLLESLQVSRQVFVDNHGCFTPEQEQIIEQAETVWKNVLTLSRRSCVSVLELLNLFDEINGQQLNASLTEKLKMQAASVVAQNGITWNQLQSSIAVLNKRQHMDLSEQTALCNVVAACPDMVAVPVGLSAEQMLQRLEGCKSLAALKLHKGTIAFPEWKMAGSAESLCKKLESLCYYGRGKQTPVWSNWEMKCWAVKNLSENTELMLLLVRDERKLRKDILHRLAQSNRITGDQIQALYQAGCTRRQLREGAGDKTSLAWQTAVQKAFPAWPELPPPLEPLEARSNAPFWMAVLHCVLLGIAALIPALTMLLMGVTDMVTCLILIGIFVISAAVCMIVAAVARKQELRRYLLTAGLSLLPGLLAALAILLTHVLM